MSEVIYKFFSGKSGNYIANCQTAIRDLEDSRNTYGGNAVNSKMDVDAAGALKSMNNMLRILKDKQSKRYKWDKSKQKMIFPNVFEIVSKINDAIYENNGILAQEYSNIMALYIGGNFASDGKVRMDAKMLHDFMEIAYDRAAKVDLEKKIKDIEEKIISAQFERNEILRKFNAIKEDIELGRISADKEPEAKMLFIQLKRQIEEIEKTIKRYEANQGEMTVLLKNIIDKISVYTHLNELTDLVGKFDTIGIEEYTKSVERIVEITTKLYAKRSVIEDVNKSYEAQSPENKSAKEFDELMAKGKKAQETNKSDDEFRYNGNMQG